MNTKTIIFFGDLSEIAQKRIIQREEANVMNNDPTTVEIKDITVDESAFGDNSNPANLECKERVRANIDGKEWCFVWDCNRHYLKAEPTRWIPGYLIRHKADKNRMAIVEGDYAYLHGGRGVDSLSIGELDNEGNVESVWAWAHRDEWELIDTEHVKKNILKLVEFKDKVNSI